MKRLFFILTCVFSVLFSCGYEVIYVVMSDVYEQENKSDSLTDANSIIDAFDTNCCVDFDVILTDITEDYADIGFDYYILKDNDFLGNDFLGNDFLGDEFVQFGDSIDDYFDAGYIDDVSQDVLVISDIRNIFDFGSKPERPRCDDKAKECENYCENERTWVICLYDNVNDCYYFYKVDCPNYEPKYGCHNPKIGCSCLNYNETVCKQDDGTYKCEDLINGGWAGFAMPHCGDCNTKCPSDKPKCKEGKCVGL